MASSKLTRALPMCRMAHTHYNSFSTLSKASKLNSSAYQLPEVHRLGFEEANIGRNLTGVSDIVMQIDGAWHKGSMTGGAAWIVKDDKLKSITGGCSQSYAASSLEMQALACLHGIKWARTRQMRSVRIYTESLDLVKILQGNVPLDISLLPTIEEIKYKSVLLDWCCIKKVARSRILLARNAAIACRGGLLTPDRFF